MKKNIEQEVATLTPEQKDSLPNIYKTQMIGQTLILAVALIIATICFARFSIKENAAEDNYNLLTSNQNMTMTVDGTITNSLSLDSTQMNSIHILDNNDAQLQLLEEKNEMGTYKWVSLVVCGVAGIICLFILHIFLKKKHPYYSGKKYKYLKNNNIDK